MKDEDIVRQVIAESPNAQQLSTLHVKAISKAPRVFWETLSNVTLTNGWNLEETILAVDNLHNPDVSAEHRAALLAGKTEPITFREDGKPAVLRSTVKRLLAQEKDKDFRYILENARYHIAQLRRFSPSEVVDSIGEERLRTAIQEMPEDIEYLKDILEEGEKALERR